MVGPSGSGLQRRAFIAVCGGLGSSAVLIENHQLRPIAVRINIMFDQGSHGGKGLTEREQTAFWGHQERARLEFLTSGIVFNLQLMEGAFLRKQGYSDIPDKFLVRTAINLFVTESLGYDIDRDRTGGCSIGPRPRGPRSPADPFFKTFLGLREASERTLQHEFAHHFTLDTAKNPTSRGNLWADLRNDYLLWRQRHGVQIPEFRACAGTEWAKDTAWV